jgi:four helix bundle protein
MGARTHRDLRAWQLSDEIRRLVIGVCRRDHVRPDFQFCRQADSAAGSACRNLAEGFARYQHRDFARFVTISSGSLTELLDLVDEARAKGYVDTQEHADLDAKIGKAIRTANGLRRYLQNTATPKERLRHGPRAKGSS